MGIDLPSLAKLNTSRTKMLSFFSWGLTLMKAVIIHHYGSTEALHYENLEKPQIKSDQILVKVHATSVNPVDWKIRQGMLKFLTGKKFPMSLGLDLSGEVVAVGDSITRFKPGDLVYADLGYLPGGAYAEYAAVPEESAALKPTNMTHEQAAAVPVAGLTALQALRDHGQIRPEHQVLIIGASGGVGSFAVQLAKSLGAIVTAVCSTRNSELVKSLGADRIIDYTQQDFTQDPTRYDIIFDAVSKHSFSHCKGNLKSKGVYIATLPSFDRLLQGFLTTFKPGKKAKLISVKARGQDLVYLKNLIEAGKLRSVIDRTYPLSEVAAAHAYSETERTVGKIVMTVAT